MIRRSRLEIAEAIVGDRYKDVLAELPGIITANDVKVLTADALLIAFSQNHRTSIFQSGRDKWHVIEHGEVPRMHNFETREAAEMAVKILT